MDMLVSVIDPVWIETLPASYIFNRDGKVVKKVQGKKTHRIFQGAGSRCGPLILRDFSSSGDSRGIADDPPQTRR